ncbi:MAG: NrdH-redoxin [Frankiales bacterium]|nr:NrdH-redoxin [Frankiales bacterium]
MTFVTRDGCTMCAEALPVVQRVCTRAGAELTVLDVDADPALAEHSDHVPVVLVDGTVVARWWVDEKNLARALR